MMEKASTRSPVPLKCIGIVLCEAAYPIAGRASSILVGTLNTLYVRGCPCRIAQITVMYTVTGGHGTYDMGIAIVHAASDRSIVSAKERYTAKDPLTISDTVISFGSFPMPALGKYWVEVRCNDEIIGQRPFYVEVPKVKGTAVQ